jgi:class 3 adenylate cyclase
MNGLFILAMVFVAGCLGFLAGKKQTARQACPPDSKTPGQQEELTAEKNKCSNIVLKPFLQKFEMVTVLFADIEGFSEITDSMEPEMLLDELNSFFFYFDTVVDRYHIEKIKTMGDAYMCAGGIPKKNHTNPVEMVLVAMEIQHHLNILRKHNPNVWSIRIGINSGQVMAGMLGYTKLSYDVWGHTVNVASRLESTCKAGEISISNATYESVKDFFICEYQGKLPDKLNGEVSYYYVKALKSEFIDENAEGTLKVNRNFRTRMQLLRIADLETCVKEKFKNSGTDLLFHNFRHTKDVLEQVELLGVSEQIPDENMLLLKTAALFHDAGYIVSYENACEMSEEIARETLPLFEYEDGQIECVCRLMKASHYEYVPQLIDEMIIHDANLMYYGRTDFISSMKNLFHEQQAHQRVMQEKDWFQHQIEYFSSHRFYTKTAQNFISVSKKNRH